MKYLSLFILITFCVAVCAQTPTTPTTPTTPSTPTTTPSTPSTPEMDATAKSFLDKASAFADKYLTQTEKLDTFKGSLDTVDKDGKTVDGTGFLGEIENMANEVKNAPDNFNPAAYMSGLEGKVDVILDKSDMKDSKYTDVRKSYLQEIANFCMKEYLKDMKDGISGTRTADYLGDVETLGQSKLNEINDIKNPPTSTSVYYDPQKSLDTVYGIGAARTDVIWGGVENHLLSYKLVDVLNRVKTRYYSSSSNATSDFNDLYKNFNQASAMDVMRNAGDPNIYDNYGTTGQSYVIDDYGKIVNQFSTNTGTGSSGDVLPPANDGTYNNRSYGYKYTNGTYTTIKLAVNGREYTLQETIYTSPIILDLNGDNKLEASKGEWLPHQYNNSKVVEFDMDGDGFMDLCEWVGPNDGILLVYKAGEDVTANNLFGTTGGFYHGYEKLSLLDQDNDGKLTGDELVTLSVWQDKNVNGKVDAGEISAVQELGITSINLKHNAELVSSFEQNGATKKVWDWYPNVFRVKRKQ